jgi:hypothetical protein
MSMPKFFQASSRNLLFLIVGMVILVIGLMGPFQNVLKEQKNLDHLNLMLEKKESEKIYWEGEKARWDDDKFIIAYARENYGLIMPGELSMHVLQPDSVGTDKDLENFDVKTREDLTITQKQFNEYKIPWYERLEGAF